MSTFLTGCNIEENIEVPKESLKLTRPIRSRRPQSHRAGSTSKKTQLKEDRDFQIFRENQILLKKMIYIDSKPSSFAKIRTQSAPMPNRSKSRIQQQFRIDLENKRFKNRLRNTNSHYSIIKFEQENKYREYLKKKICKKPVKIEVKTQKINLDQELIDKILRRREQRLEKKS